MTGAGSLLRTRKARLERQPERLWGDANKPSEDCLAFDVLKRDARI